MSFGVCCRCGLDMALLQLWCGPSALALIQLLASELPYAVGAGLKRPKKKFPSRIKTFGYQRNLDKFIAIRYAPQDILKEVLQVKRK